MLLLAAARPVFSVVMPVVLLATPVDRLPTLVAVVVDKVLIDASTVAKPVDKETTSAAKVTTVCAMAMSAMRVHPVNITAAAS